MIKDLSLFVCVSKITGKVLSMPKRVADTEIGSAKKGVRYCNNLEYHQAAYDVLNSAGALSVVRMLSENCDYKVPWGASLQTELDNFKKRVVYHHTDKEYVKYCTDVMNLLQVIIPHVNDIKNAVQQKLSWDELTCVQWYSYNPDTNQMEPFDHRRQKKVK